MGEIERLNADGYRVLIEEPEAMRSRAGEGAIEFNQWMERMRPVLELQRKSK